MHIQYGDYKHVDDNDVSSAGMRFDVRPTYGQRGTKVSNVYTMHIWGELTTCEATRAGAQLDLHNKIGALIDAYMFNNKSAALFHDDNTMTRHFMLAGTYDQVGIIDGPKLIHRSWPWSDGSEYATQRTYSITLQATVAAVEDELVFWSEQVLTRGTGGAKWSILYDMDGVARQQSSKLKTPVLIVQDGYSVGRSDYIYSLGPIFPDFNHSDREEQGALGADAFPHAYADFKYRWHYEMSIPTWQQVLPVVI